MAAVSYRSDASTDAGHVRRRNEDAVYENRALGIYLVVDGMGGQAAGEQAAQIAQRTLRRQLEESKGSAERRIRDAIAAANNAIFQEAQARPEWQGMGCVLTVALVEGARLHYGHVGDTRLYKLHRGQIRKVTRDHSPVGEREDANEIGEREAMQHPRRNEVYRDVGAAPHTADEPGFIDTGAEEFEPDAAFLLCSDGLSDVLTREEIRALVEQHAGSPKRVTGRLIETATETGKDNVSAVYIEGPAFAPSRPNPNEDTGKWRPPAKRRPYVLPLVAALALLAGAFLGYSNAARLVPRTLQVGPNAIVSIGDALDQARPGDRVLVDAGDYRETVRLKSGVSLVANGHVVLLGAGNPSDPIVVADSVRDAGLSGFVLHPDQGKWVEKAVAVHDSEVSLQFLNISGATVAAVEFTGRSSGRLAASYLHENRGNAVSVEAEAAPRIEHNQFSSNGHPAVRWLSLTPPVIVRNTFSSPPSESMWFARKPEQPLDTENVFLPAPSPVAPVRPRGTR